MFSTSVDSQSQEYFQLLHFVHKTNLLRLILGSTSVQFARLFDFDLLDSFFSSLYPFFEDTVFSVCIAQEMLSSRKLLLEVDGMPGISTRVQSS